MPSIIETVTAHCQDCYRCVRVCPIGAIRVKGGQARVDNALCIQCGTCVRECPQRAKTAHPSQETIQAWMDAGKTIAASVSPSFAAIYDKWKATRIPAALRLLGFSSVSEAAEGAKAVAAETAAQRGKASITTSCPAVVTYVEKYRPALLPLLMPVVSPMIAHGRMLKARLGDDVKVVYIGPCVAKKDEALQADYAGAVDAVMTFDELDAWIASEGIDLGRCPESGFDTYGELGAARLSCIEGGLLKTAGILTDLDDGEVLHLSGPESVMQLLDTPLLQWPYDVVELSFCRGGCVGGPCMPKGNNALIGRRNVVAYANQASSLPGDLPQVDLHATFSSRASETELPDVGEQAIQQVLEGIGKGDAAKQLNCGACGYETCREYAVAVVRDMAEPGMCISYARQKAERRANHIISNSPNGIVTVDKNLNIVHMNARFQKMFDCGGSLIGQPVSRIVDPEGFEKLLAGAEGLQEAIRTRDGMKYQELIFTLPGDEEVTGIYVDVSGSTFDAKQVDLIKDQSLKHARDLLAHQIRFSQEMAHYLGKSTAQTEDLVRRLLDMYAEEPQ